MSHNPLCTPHQLHQRFVREREACQEEDRKARAIEAAEREGAATAIAEAATTHFVTRNGLADSADQYIVVETPPVTRRVEWFTLGEPARHWPDWVRVIIDVPGYFPICQRYERLAIPANAWSLSDVGYGRFTWHDRVYEERPTMDIWRSEEVEADCFNGSVPAGQLGRALDEAYYL